MYTKKLKNEASLLENNSRKEISYDNYLILKIITKDDVNLDALRKIIEMSGRRYIYLKNNKELYVIYEPSMNRPCKYYCDMCLWVLKTASQDINKFQIIQVETAIEVKAYFCHVLDDVYKNYLIENEKITIRDAHILTNDEINEKYKISQNNDDYLNEDMYGKMFEIIGPMDLSKIDPRTFIN